MVDAIRQIIQRRRWRPEIAYLRRPKLPQFAAVAFFSKSSPFSRLRKALDCRITEMTAAGVVRVSVKRADPV